MKDNLPPSEGIGRPPRKMGIFFNLLTMKDAFSTYCILTTYNILQVYFSFKLHEKWIDPKHTVSVHMILIHCNLALYLHLDPGRILDYTVCL